MSKFNKNDILALGLENASIGSPTTIPSTLSSPILRGLVVDESPGVFDEAKSDYSPIGVPIAERVGFTFESSTQDPSYLLVKGDNPFVFRPEGAKGIKRLAKDAITFCRQTLADPFSLLKSDDIGLILKPEEDNLWVYPLDNRPLNLSPALEVKCPLTTWIDTCQDEWLCDQISKRDKVDDSWERVVAVGMFARLESDEFTTFQSLEDLMSGVSERLDRERSWARKLSAENCAAIERLAVLHTEHLFDELLRLVKNPLPHDSQWKQDMQRIMHKRDDLEGICLLLREAGEGDLLVDELLDIDVEGDLWIDAIPSWDGDFDERLLRASLVSPEGWWTRLTEWE